MGIGFGGCGSHGDHQTESNPHCPNVFGCQGKPGIRTAVRDVSLPSWGPRKAEAGGRSRRSVQVFGTSPSRAGDRGGRSQRSTQPFGTSPSRAGDREGPVSAHPLLGPRKWSPGRAGSKAEGTYPVSCRPGGWSAAWVRGATAAVELEGASTASAGSPHLEPHVGRQM